MARSTILGLAISFFLTSCVTLENRRVFPRKVWEASERSGLMPSRELQQFNVSQMQRYIRLPLNPEKKEDGSFDLYYFMQTPAGGVPEIKTVLFCGGGPGELVEPGDASLVTFLRKFNATNYNVVYFHIRGTGQSQLPPSNRYDKFLRTKFAVEDIEEIRKRVLGDRPWDGIVGYSYGTVLAQQYAGKYSNKVRKMILVAPLSMHKYNGASSMTAYEEYSTQVRRIRQEILDNVFDKNTEFKDKLTITEKKEIKDALARVFDIIESNFGSEKFIIDRYCELKDRGILYKYALQDYSRLFFEKLRELRNIGWKPFSGPPGNPRANQVEAVQVISVGLKAELRNKLGDPKPDDECTATDGQTSGTDTSDRTLYTMRTNDGADRVFLKEWVAEGRSGIHSALRRSAGFAHVQNGVNQSIEKVGIADDAPINPWDPAEHLHSVPTLILEGGADPVTADGQPDYYFKRALIGPRTLIHFPGVGHEFKLPSAIIDQPYLVGSIRIDPGKITPGAEVIARNTITSFPPQLKKNVLESPVDCQGAIFVPRSHAVFVQVNNSTPSDQNAKCQIVYEHRLLKATVLVDSPKVPHGLSWVSGSVKEIVANFTVAKPANLEKGLEFEYYMDHWDELIVKIKNVSGGLVEAKPKQWMLVTTEESSGKVESPCQGSQLQNDQPATSCLIYSFLEMEYEDFRSDKNLILTELKDQELAGPPQHLP